MISRRLKSSVTDRVVVIMAMARAIIKRRMWNYEVILTLNGLEVVGSLDMIGLI